MTLKNVSVMAVGLVVAAGIPAGAQSVQRSAQHDYRVVTVAEGLVQPWAIAWLPNGDALITERPGRLRIVRNGKLLPQAVEGVPAAVFAGQGGLLEVAVHPNFATNKFLYITYSKTKADGSGTTTALVRGTFENDRLTNVQQLFESVSTGRGHFGGKIAFDGKGFLFLTLGDRQVPPEGDLEKHPGAGPHQPSRQARPPARRRQGARRQPVREAGRRQARDLELRASQHPGHRHRSGDRQRLDRRTRPAGRGRAQPRASRAQLRLAGDRLRRELPDRQGDPQRHDARGHGTADARLGAVDRHLGRDVLHRRPLPRLEGQSLRRRDGRRAGRAA